MTHTCVSKLTTIGSDNGLSPGRCQAIIWTNTGILLIGPLGTNFIEILIGIQTFSFKKMHLKMSSAKWRSFCLGLNELSMHFNLTTITSRPSQNRCHFADVILKRISWSLNIVFWLSSFSYITLAYTSVSHLMGEKLCLELDWPSLQANPSSHWPLWDVEVILQVYFSNSFYEFISWTHPLK